MGKFTHLGLETNNYDGNTTLCMASAVMGYNQTFGSDDPTDSYEDFSHADVILLIGANIADNHPILKLHIAKNKKITGKKPTIIVVDPRKSKTSQMADIFVPIKPRSDLALLNGLCYIIFEQGWDDLNTADAVELKVKSGDRISISGNRGKVDDVIVKVSETVREGNIFVPFHFNEQLINNVTIPEFDPKSFEPNYKQCAVQLHSQAVPKGIRYPEKEVSGLIENKLVQKERISGKEKIGEHQVTNRLE